MGCPIRSLSLLSCVHLVAIQSEKALRGEKAARAQPSQTTSKQMLPKVKEEEEWTTCAMMRACPLPALAAIGCVRVRVRVPTCMCCVRPSVRLLLKRNSDFLF